MQNEDSGPRLSLTHEMHDRGINMRCLGLLYEAVTCDYWKTRLLTEMIIRIAKVSMCVCVCLCVRLCVCMLCIYYIYWCVVNDLIEDPIWLSYFCFFLFVYILFSIFLISLLHILLADSASSDAQRHAKDKTGDARALCARGGAILQFALWPVCGYVLCVCIMYVKDDAHRLLEAHQLYRFYVSHEKKSTSLQCGGLLKITKKKEYIYLFVEKHTFATHMHLNQINIIS